LPILLDEYRSRSLLDDDFLRSVLSENSNLGGDSDIFLITLRSSTSFPRKSMFIADPDRKYFIWTVSKVEKFYSGIYIRITFYSNNRF
jgi:hypothetical protein